MKKVTRSALVVAAAGLLAVPLSVISQSRLAASEEATTRPNVVLVLTDDQDFDSMPVMRNLMARPEGSWMNFTNAFVNHAVCCPSRASILTGRYSQHHGAVGNSLCLEMDDSNTLPVWLDDAGYETALIGKYLNSPVPNNPPPGWDIFKGADLKGNEDWLSDQAVAFIDETTSPFFLYLAYGAPHREATPPSRYQNTNAFVPADHPSFNEADFSDKPIVRALLSPAEIAANRTERLNAQRELLAVDDGIQRIVDTLEQKGQLDNTLIIYISDNGYSWGDHRRYGKLCPYEECVRVPLLIRYPGLSGNQDEDGFASNVDLAWTIADYAGVAPQLSQDGRSLLPLLDGSATDWTNEVLLERYNPIFYGIRTQRWKYIDHKSGNAAGKQELYDLGSDPYELNNLAGKVAYQAIESQMAQRLQVLLDRPPVLPPPVTTPTATPTVIPSPVSTATSTPTEEPSPTPTETLEPTATPTEGPSSTPTDTPEPSSTPTDGPSPTPTETPRATPTVMPTASATPPTTNGIKALVSLAADSVVAGITVADEDIMAYDVASGQWSLLFDGSRFGLSAADIDAFYDHHGQFLLISLNQPFKLSGLGTVDDSDILRFVPNSPGNYTAGHLEWYFDGSAAQLTAKGEDIDALALLPDGRLLISLFADDSRVTIGGTVVRPRDEDILAFTGQTGSHTAGTWSWYFDGSSIGLTTSSEDVNGVDVSATQDVIYLTTVGNFRLSNGLSGVRSDIMACHTNPGSGGGMKTCTGGVDLFLRGSAIGLGSKLIDGLQIVQP